MDREVLHSVVTKLLIRGCDVSYLLNDFFLLTGRDLVIEVSEENEGDQGPVLHPIKKGGHLRHLADLTLVAHQENMRVCF